MHRLGLAALLVLSVFSANDVAAQIISSGTTLKERCATMQLTSPASGLACRGYIGAVVDILTDGNAVDGLKACPPAPAKREEAIKTVKAWVSRNPDQLPEQAYKLVARALAEHYPC